MGSYSLPVQIKSCEIIAPKVPCQEHWLPLSNLDLLLPTVDLSFFFCYKKPHDENINPKTIADVIKNTLALALVSFYPLAGQIVPNMLGETELHCNNRGVDFVHAYCDDELKDLDLHHPDDSVRGKLVPVNKEGVVSVQLTELKCGGLVVGCTFNHRVVDAYSVNFFLTRWSEIARYNDTKTHTPPCFRRSLLSAHGPPYHDSIVDRISLKASALPPIETSDDRFFSRIYCINADDIKRIQSLAGGKRTKLESFSAFLWKTIAEGEDIENFKLGIVVDSRKRMTSTEEKKAQMENYIGNALSFPFKVESVSELKSMSLQAIANLVHECIQGAIKEEHFFGLIDRIELQRPEQIVPNIYCKMSDDEEGILVSSGLRFLAAAMDFGAGKQCFGSIYFPWGGQTGYVMPIPSFSKKGDWIVYVWLLKKHLDAVEQRAGDVFKPLTSGYALGEEE